MIKAIFFDVDGTLISFKTHKMPKDTRESLEKLRKKGIKLFLATGRSPGALGMLKKIVDFEFDGYVTFNGQYCIVENEVIHKMTIPKETFKRLVPYLEEKNISCEFSEIDRTYINFKNERVETLEGILGSTAENVPIGDINRVFVEDIYQMCAFITPEEEESFLKHSPKCDSVRWNEVFADIINVKGGKDIGIEKILDYFGLTKEESMAFGDGGNDIEMLKYVHLGVAMGNAGGDVKESADFVTLDVDSGGITFALDKFGVLS